MRHALRRNGTVLIVDRNRTPDLPFDLSAYRAVMFTGDVPGSQRLREELAAIADRLPPDNPEYRDNPVHDFLRDLPANSLDVSRNEELEAMRRALEDRDRRDVGQAGQQESPALATVRSMLSQARAGTLPTDLVRNARSAADQQNPTAFLETVQSIFQRHLGLTQVQYRTLAASARALELFDVVEAVLAEAQRKYPGDRRITEVVLEQRARRSTDPAERAAARSEILRRAGITLSDGNIDVPEHLPEDGEQLLGTLLDSLRDDGLNEDELRITHALIERFPDRTFPLRNHARALERSGALPAAEELFVRAERAANADATSAIWLGHFMSGQDRYVDALEAYLHACLLDPEAGMTFSNAALGMAAAWRAAITARDRSSRSIPDHFSGDRIPQLLIAAFSCDTFDGADFARCLRTVDVGELDPAIIEALSSMRSGDSTAHARQSIGERYELARTLHAGLAIMHENGAGTVANDASTA